MSIRKIPLVSGQYYHIVSRSISKYRIFNTEQDFEKMKEIMKNYQFSDFAMHYSEYCILSNRAKTAIHKALFDSENRLVEIIAYCIMPTHIHLLLKQITENGISRFISKSLNSYSKSFNSKHKRKGPLWEGRFKNVLVNSNEQLLHLTRYIHLNPASAGLVDKPEDWKYSSYGEYLKKFAGINDITVRGGLFDFSPARYKEFVEERISYQRKLSIIKKLLIDGYAG